MSRYLMRAPAYRMPASPAGGHRQLTLAAVGRLALLLVALAGLFATHVLSDHGVGGAVALPHGSAGYATSPELSHELAHGGTHNTSAETASLAASSAVGMPQSAHPASGPAFGPASGSVSVSPAGGSSGDVGDSDGGHGELLVGVCLAILAAVLLVCGVAAWRTRLSGWARGGGFDLTRAVATAVRARTSCPAAPDLRCLSVQRC